MPKLSNLKKEVADVKRLRHIVEVLFKYGFGFYLKKAKLKHLLPIRKRSMNHKFKKGLSNPERLRLAFEELGGTFIKLGQLLSLRADLIPPEYSEELSKLQDSVKPFPFSQVKEIIKDELGMTINKAFAEFNPQPIAAASVGQVHEAKLKTGEKVAVKIKRPGVNKLFYSDIHLLYHIAKLLDKHYDSKIVNAESIVKEFQKYTIRELDYIREAKNIKRFYNNFKGDKSTRIPKVYWDYTTHKIITMEFMKGIKISDTKKLKRRKYDTKKIAENLALSVLKQIFIDGVFHADPHPANVLVGKDQKIILIDFGITGFLEDSLKEDSSDLLMGMINGDVDFIVECLLSLGLVDEPINIQNLKEDLVDNLAEYRDTSLKYVELSSLFNSVIHIAKDNKIKLPANFILLGKSIVTVESSCVLLNPDFNLIEVASPFVKKLARIKLNPKNIAKRTISYAQRMRKFLSKLPEQSEQVLIEIKDADRTIKSIDRDIRGLTSAIDRAGSHFVLGLIVVGLIVGGTMMIKFDQKLLFGIPLYSALYLFLAVIITLFLLFSSMHNNILRRK